MTASDSELLQRFTRDGDEDAFTELVRRHVNLVFSAALRQLGGNAQTAEDITQIVFTDLARKARSLVAHPTLIGWLYTGVRLAATRHRRSESRRLKRETAIPTMTPTPSSEEAEPDWNRLRLVLDDAMHDLNEPDREAVLLRYFDQRPLAEIGARLGLSENATRMRVERALDKLHAALMKRGITSTATAIVASLGARAVSAAPAGIVERIGPSILAASAGAGTGAMLSAKLALGAVAVCLGVGVLLWTNRPDPATGTGSEPGTGPLAGSASSGVDAIESGESSGITPASGGSSSGAASASGNNSPLILRFVAKDTGRPVPSVAVNYRGWEATNRTQTQFIATREGEARVHVVPGTTEFELISVMEGYADTRLRWSPARGQVIPNEYEVRLERAVPIGGTVVDPNGQPVPGATVGWNHEQDGSQRAGVESHEFGWIAVETDSDGRWRINRMAASILSRSYGGARHPEFQPSEPVFLSQSPGQEQALREATHVFRMNPGAWVHGSVVDEAENPVAGAEVLVGLRGMVGSREALTAADGSFLVQGAPLGSVSITAQAKGYASTTIQAGLAEANEPLRLVLGRGTPLRLRVVNRAGDAVPGATVWLNTLSPPRPVSAPAPLLLQAGFKARTDAAGRVTWDDAPSGTHQFDIHARGYMRTDRVSVNADGSEHVVVLKPALVVQGRVTDAATGRPIPDFRMTLGWSLIDPVSQQAHAQFTTLDRFWLNFAGGTYRHSIEEQIPAGHTDPRCVLKFEAEGYLPHITRPLRYDEGEVTLDVAFEPADQLTVTVLSPDGRPAAGAEIGSLIPGSDLRLKTGGLVSMHTGSGSIKRAGADGTIRLTDDPQATRLVTAHPTGYAETTFQALETNPTIRLLSWGRIEGEIRGKPDVTAGRQIALSSWEENHGEFGFDISTMADDAGRFTLPQVPPVRLKVNLMIVMEVVSEHRTGTASYPGQYVEATVEPGQTTRVTFVGGGYRITGRVRLPSGFNMSPDAQWFASLHPPLPEPPADIRGDTHALRSWVQSPQIQEISRRSKAVPIQIRPDGTFSADSVSPGEYRFSASLLSPAGPEVQGTQTHTRVLAAAAEVNIPGEPATGEIDLGEIMAGPPTTAP